MGAHSVAADEKMEGADGMRNRVERLRLWLLGSAGFLLLVIAAFLGTAHFLSRHRLALPARLGVNIVRETNGYTYSQAVQGKTVFTIHAAKAVEHTDNKIALHDVSIALYGEKQDRNDRIYGDEFEYDQKAGVVRATGLVHLDLQTAEADGGGKGGGKDSASGAKVLHVTTSGLVYLKDLGVAATNEVVEFQSGAMTGHATGASFSRDSGLLMLHSAVSMSGMAGKRALTVTAATADLDNPNQEIFLTQAKCVTQEQTVEAQRATLHTRPDGTLARVEAEGDVTMAANGATLVSERTDVILNAKSQPQSALLTGGVKYSDDQPLRQLRGEAQEATIAFNAQAKPRPEDAVFGGAVHLTERTRAAAAANEPWSTRDLTAAKVEARLAPASAGRPQLRDVEATGSARLVVVGNGSAANARGEGRTELTADDLKAHWIEAKDGRQPPRLNTVAGRGHTLLQQVTADGIDETSSGDSLDAKFRPESSGNISSSSRLSTASARLNTAKARPAGAAAGGHLHGGAVSPMGGEGVDDLLSAVQQGHVTMARRAPAGGASGRTGIAREDLEQATAERAAYDGDLDRVTLTGGVEVSDRASALWADQVVMYRTSGDAHASGSVKVSYLAQAGGNQPSGLRGTAPASTLQPATPIEPTHVVAASADVVRATKVATFYGKPARLWQAGSQVQAPVIQLQLVEQSGTWELSKLIAHGDVTGSAGQVRTILVHAADLQPSPDKLGTAKPRSAKTGNPLSCSAKSESTMPSAEKNQRLPSVVRITSGQLIYSGDLRQAEVTGGVRAETVDGTIRAAQATVYLQPDAKGIAASPPSAASARASPQLAGKVERMIATGQIQIDQPGLRATGGRLVYTAADGLFVLTGDGKLPPKLVDSECGTITGAALQFHSGDDSVEVTSVEPGGAATGQRVRTETHAGKDATMGKGK
jgi:lipopolysaccharide export system protein LptA